MLNYGFSKETDLSFEVAINVVTEELKKEGFGVLQRLDIHKKLQEKIGVDFKRYAILGACDPHSAYKVLQAEEHIGLFLPCNVIVFDRAEKTVIAIIKPSVMMAMIENDDVKEVACDVETRLKKVMDAIN